MPRVLAVQPLTALEDALALVDRYARPVPRRRPEGTTHAEQAHGARSARGDDGPLLADPQNRPVDQAVPGALALGADGTLDIGELAFGRAVAPKASGIPYVKER